MSEPSLHFLRARHWPVARWRHTCTMPKPPEPSWDTHSQSGAGAAITWHVSLVRAGWSLLEVVRRSDKEERDKKKCQVKCQAGEVSGEVSG